MSVCRSIIVVSTIKCSFRVDVCFCHLDAGPSRVVEKMKLLNEALGAAKKNVARFQKRHHVVLKKICSYTKKLWLKLEQPLMSL